MMLALFFWITALCWLFVAVASTVGILDLLTLLANWGACAEQRGDAQVIVAPKAARESLRTARAIGHGLQAVNLDEKPAGIFQSASCIHSK